MLLDEYIERGHGKRESRVEIRPDPVHDLLEMSWLRVFTSANTAHLGHNGGQEREPGVMPSEKYAARRGSVEDGRRRITVCFARAPQRCTRRTYMHILLMFQEVRPISKTRNQLNRKIERPVFNQ